MEPDKDLAVLKIQNLSRDALRPVAVGSSSGLQVGQRVFAIGKITPASVCSFTEYVDNRNSIEEFFASALIKLVSTTTSPPLQGIHLGWTRRLPAALCLLSGVKSEA